MSARFYMIDENRKITTTDDVLEWGRSFEHSNKSVARDTIGDIIVSTVFLGLNHRFSLGPEVLPPILFETMIFGGEHDQHQDRCCSWDEAEEMHRVAVDMVLDSITAKNTKNE